MGEGSGVTAKPSQRSHVTESCGPRRTKTARARGGLIGSGVEEALIQALRSLDDKGGALGAGWPPASGGNGEWTRDRRGGAERAIVAATAIKSQALRCVGGAAVAARAERAGRGRPAWARVIARRAEGRNADAPIARLSARQHAAHCDTRTASVAAASCDFVHRVRSAACSP